MNLELQTILHTLTNKELEQWYTELQETRDECNEGLRYITKELFRRMGDKNSLEIELLELYKRKAETLQRKLDNVVDLIEEDDPEDDVEKVLHIIFTFWFPHRIEDKGLRKSTQKTINIPPRLEHRSTLFPLLTKTLHRFYYKVASNHTGRNRRRDHVHCLYYSWKYNIRKAECTAIRLLLARQR